MDIAESERRQLTCRSAHDASTAPSQKQKERTAYIHQADEINYETSITDIIFSQHYFAIAIGLLFTRIIYGFKHRF